jgi:hypothetical protein
VIWQFVPTIERDDTVIRLLLAFYFFWHFNERHSRLLTENDSGIKVE